MCEGCVADTDLICAIFQGWYLVRAKKDGHIMKAGDFGLVRCNDPDFIFSAFPALEPHATLPDEEIGNLPESERNKWKDWFCQAQNFDKELKTHDVVDFENVYNLVAAAKENGYSQEKNGWFAGWLFDYLGECLKANGIVK